MARRSRVTTVRLALEEHQRLSAAAAARGISLGELIRRVLRDQSDETSLSGSPGLPPCLDGDAFAAELRVLEMRIESLATVVETKLGNLDRLITSLTDQTNAISALAAAVQAQTLSIERLTKALYRRE